MKLSHVLLIGGLCVSTAALCDEGPILQGSKMTSTMSAERVTTHCYSNCVMKLGNAAVQIEAAEGLAESATGVLRLEVGVRVKFQDGSEVRSESLTIRNAQDGSRELRSDELQFTKVKSN
jgi:hypothetical protein